MAFVRCTGNVNTRNSYSGLLGCKVEQSGGPVLGEAVLQNCLDTRHHTVDFTSSRTVSLPSFPEHVLSGHVPADADFPCGKVAVLANTKTRACW